MITSSAPGKIHLLGEHVVVYGKPAILTTVDIRVSVSVIPAKAGIQKTNRLKNIIERIVKNHLKIKEIPPYQIKISSQIPIGAGLGSSAAVSAAYIAALLSFLKVKWDKKLINELTFEAEKVFHGNPSGGDNSTVVYGGLIWYQKKSPTEKIIKPLLFSIPAKLAKNFVLINTGKPKEPTKEMVEGVSAKYRVNSKEFNKIFNSQEKLVKQLLKTLRKADEKKFIEIIRAGEKNLEEMGVVSEYAKSIIRKIESMGGAAKVCGGGGKTKATGVLLCYHPDPSIIQNIAKLHKLEYIKTSLGVEGLRQE